MRLDQAEGAAAAAATVGAARTDNTEQPSKLKHMKGAMVNSNSSDSRTSSSMDGPDTSDSWCSSSSRDSSSSDCDSDSEHSSRSAAATRKRHRSVSRGRNSMAAAGSKRRKQAGDSRTDAPAAAAVPLAGRHRQGHLQVIELPGGIIRVDGMVRETCTRPPSLQQGGQATAYVYHACWCCRQSV